jgi:hypothetical protein
VSETPTVSELVSEAEASELLGVSPRTMQDWRYKHRGPPHTYTAGHAGRPLVRYRIPDLLAWRHDQETARAAEVA